ncbi:MAG: DotU family type IV/VI secretion system protein [Thermodesulfobacteriota bacterium]|nr:DotU family type IV/VI secretion system protein [Thermodesulfobacteriota bacterium]
MRLIDCFIEVITYTSHFLQTVEQEQPQFEKIKNDYAVLFNQAGEYLKKGDFSPEEWDMARFAVCAWVDESVLCSSWEGKASWEHEQLQRIYYGATNAGEEFFDRLRELDPDAKGVREVYAYCLALSFKGRYFRKEDEFQLENIKSSNLKYVSAEGLLDKSLQGTVNLFPGAYKAASDDKAHKLRSPFSLFTLIFLISPPILFGILFFLYRDILQKFVTNFFG